MSRKHAMLVLVGLLSLSLLLFGCSGPSGEPSAPSGDEITEIIIANPTDVTTMDPGWRTVMSDQYVNYYTLDTLFIRTPEGDLVPSLAESIEALSDTEWEVKLVEGVTFHNGESFDAETVKFSFDRMFNPDDPSPSAGRFDTIIEVRVVDDHTVHLITAEPDPLVPARIAQLDMVPPGYYQEHGRDHFASNPVGTGPYVFKEWVKDDRVVLEANPDYFLGEPSVPRIIFKPIPEYSTRLALLRTGEVHLIPNVYPDDAADLGGEDGIEVYSTNTMRTMELMIRPDLEPTDNKLVRQAMNYAVDKEAIVNEILSGFGEVANAQVIGPMYFGYHPELEAYPYDPDRARELLAEAGYPDGVDVEFYTPAGRYTMDTEIAEAVTEMLNDVGIRAQLTKFEWGVYAQLQQDKDLGHINLFGFMNPMYDADGVMHGLFRSGVIWGVGPYWQVDRVDELIQEGRTVIDPDTREAIYHELAEILRDEAPVIFMHHMTEIYGARDFVEFTPRPDDCPDVFGKPFMGQ